VECFLRVDSCRNCGIELQVMQFCSTCDQPLHFECNDCTTFIDNPIHNHDYLTSQSFLQSLGVNVN